jgi:hypothetical protein
VIGLAALASAGLLVAGLAPASGEPGTVAAEPFSNGAAKATAIVSRIAPGVGSLELALANGVAVSELKNQLTQAQAQSLDLGLIGTTLTAEGCSGGDAPVTPDDLPQPTRVDNRQGDAADSSDEVPLAGSELGGGRESARATATLAQAVATSAASVSPVLSVAGGRATATVEVIDGAARQAHATVEADVAIAGTVELTGLRWDARHRTGKDPAAEASFDIGTAKLLGAEVPVDSLSTLAKALNAALAPIGITLDLPHVERFKQPSDLVRVTPLRVVLKDSPAGKTALGPGLDLTREQRFKLFNDLASSFCQSAGALLVGDIGVSIASGSGFLAVEVGGAEAISGDLAMGSPFGSPVAPVLGTPLPGPADVGAVAGLPATAPAGATAGPAGTEVATAPVASIGPLERLCTTVHPFDWPSCSKGAMAPLGLLGLIATGGIGALDWRHQRRLLAAGERTASPAGAPA